VITAAVVGLGVITISTMALSDRQFPTTTTAAPATTVVVPLEQDGVVASITDGDTFRVILPDGSNEPVRLIGIDAPEPDEPRGPEARALLYSLINDRTVRLVPDVSDRDQFDRLLRYVYVDDLFVNEAMVDSGLADARRYEPDTAMAEVLEAAYRRAEAGTSTTTIETTTTIATTTTLAPTTTRSPTTTIATTTTAAPAVTTAAPAPNCHGSYQGECLTPGIGDYDCASGSGNGPNYVYGTVQVVGPDEFDLDRDGDGLGCES
jgi:micrococcal nuclease